MEVAGNYRDSGERARGDAGRRGLGVPGERETAFLSVSVPAMN